MQTVEGGVTPFAGDFLNYYRRIPLGVVGQITPWNHPLLIAMKKIAPALAAGNSIVVKPSELAPVAVIELGRILSEVSIFQFKFCCPCLNIRDMQAGVPPGVVNIVPGFGATAGKALAEHPKLAKVDVTGGTVTGRAIAAAAGRNLIPVTAELGGKAPMIVFDDTDVDDAVNAAAFATFIATGQTCIAATRLLVHERIIEDFKVRFCVLFHLVLATLLTAKTTQAKLKAKLEGLKLGDPMDPSTQIGPVISPLQLKRVEDFVEGALKEGATILCGGARPTNLPDSLKAGNYYLPTVIVDVKPDMNVVREEVFGPVTVVLPFKDEQEAIRLCNDSPYGLAAGIFTNDVKRAHRVARQLRVGIIWINDWHKNDPSSPWGGMKDSGFGRENGLECFREYTQTQSIVVNYSTTKSDWFGAGQARYN